MVRNNIIILVCALMLASCVQPSEKEGIQPALSFIKISKGNLETPIDSLVFANTFEPIDRNLVGVVGFSAIPSGSTVQATWFSPDDRTMPIGRETIVTSDAVDVVRFSIAPSEDWKPAPYLLDIRAWSTDPLRAATGSTHFFIGLDDGQIEVYQKEYEEWRKGQ